MEGGPGGGGGFVRRFPLYFANGFSMQVQIGAGGLGGIGGGPNPSNNPGSGQNGGDTFFYVSYASPTTGSILRAFGGGGGQAGLLIPDLNYFTPAGGSGGGVQIDGIPPPPGFPAMTAIPLRTLAATVNGEKWQLDQITGAIIAATPPSPSNVNGYYESGSGGRTTYPYIAGFGYSISPGAPSPTYSKTVAVPPSGTFTGSAGGASGLVNYGYGADSVSLTGPSDGSAGLNGGDGAFIIEYFN